MKQSWYLALGLAVATLCTPLVAGQGQSAQVLLEAARKAETIDGNPKAAIAQYEQIVKRFASDRAVVADALVRMAGAYKKLGDAQAKAIYERVVREYGDQASAASTARAALSTSKGAPNAKGDGGTVVRRVWAGRDTDATGMVSHDGRLLSFTDWTTGDLAVRDLTTHTTRRLTNKGRFARSPSYAERSVFSPDGRYVAYGWWVGEGSGYELRILDLQNPLTAPRVLTPKPLPWIAPYDWSRDGNWIAVIANMNGDGIRLYAADAQSGALREVMSLGRDQGGNGIRFSPDSRALVVDRRNGSAALASDIVAIRLVDRQEQVLVSGGARNVPLGWAPDGGLLFASTRSGSQGLWLLPLDGLTPKGPSVLLKGDVGMMSLGTTAAGAIYIGAATLDYRMQVVEIDPVRGQVVAGSARDFESYVGVNMQPSWSPDGTALAFVNRRDRAGRGMALVIRAIATGEERELLPALPMFNFPRWLPDGRSLVVQGTDAQERQGIFRIDAETGVATPVVLAPPRGNFGQPQPSLDGARLYYRRWVGEETSVVERNMSTGSERVVLSLGGVGSFALSADGASICTIERGEGSEESVVRVAPVAGGAPRQIYRGRALAAFSMAWTADGSHVLALRLTDTPARRREGVLIPVAGGDVKRLELADSATGVIAVHPDGRRLAYQVGDRTEEIWVLENFLPTAKAARK